MPHEYLPLRIKRIVVDYHERKNAEKARTTFTIYTKLTVEKPINKGTCLRPGKIRNVFYRSTRFASSDGTLII